MPNAVPLCDSFWNVVMCRTQHCAFCSFVWIRHRFFVRASRTAPSILSVVGGQCSWLPSYRQPTLVAKADGLPMVLVYMAAIQQVLPYSSQESVWSHCVKLKDHRTSGECVCSEVEEMKGQFLLPFPRTVTGRIANGHFVTFVDVAHVSCSPSQWLASGIFFFHHKSNFCLWIMNLSTFARHICPSKLLLSCQHLSCFWSCVAFLYGLV